MTITEPTTMLTDYLLTGLCFVFAWRLSRGSSSGSLGLWLAAFVVTGFAALAGGRLTVSASPSESAGLSSGA